MSLRSILYLVLIIILLGFSFFFSMLDMAYSIVKVSRISKENINSKKDQLILKYVQNYEDTIATILFSNDFVNIFASSLTSIFALSLFDLSKSNEELITVIASLILLFVMLLFCEIAPKAIAKNQAYKIIKNTVYVFAFFKSIFYVFTKPINMFLNMITSSLVDRAGEEDKIASDDELESMVDEIQKEGIIDNEQSDLIHNSISFKETCCYEVMTPRVKIFGYDIETPFSQFLKNEDCFKYSRIIVYKRNKDSILGYIPTKNLLRSLIQNSKINIKELILPIESIFRTIPISSAMQIMKKSRHHILLVRDEFGGSEGIITMEDILEELVGEIYDEKDETNKEIIPTRIENTFAVRGSLNITDLFDELNISDPEISEEYSTVSGFVIHTLGKYGKVGDHFIFRNIYFEILDVKNYIADLILVHVLSNDEDKIIKYNSHVKRRIEEIKSKVIKKHNNIVEIIKK